MSKFVEILYIRSSIGGVFLKFAGKVGLPNPKNWPGYTTAMPPMAHVPEAELKQIATWIKSLE